MNKIYCFYFLLCSFYCYSQIETIYDIDRSRPSLTYIGNDTVLALPFSSNNINILTNNPISSWYSFKSKKINLENFIIENNHIEILFSSDNNIFTYSYPMKYGYLSIGISHHAYAQLILSNNFLNLIWNGNSEYLNQSVNFSNNSLNLLQYSTLYLQYSREINKFKMGTRVSFIHGINNLSFEKDFFNLNTVNYLETPFSTYISTDIYAKTGSANFLGFSNPGMGLDFSISYNVSNFNFSANFENIGFIYWNNNTFSHQSNTSYLFDGVHYSMDQIISDEIVNTLDTLSDIFAINNNESVSYLQRLPINFKFQTSFKINSNSDFFVLLQSIEEINNDKISFFNNYYLGYNKRLSENLLVIGSYDYNKYSPINFNLGFVLNYENFIIKLNSNSLSAFLGQKSFHLNTALYYLF